jgi:uncharacterized protein
VESERLPKLIAASRRGEIAAFAELAEEYRPRLRLVATRMLGDTDEAEDLVQEALLRGYLGLTQLREADRFGAWLVGIVLNLARMTLRRRAAYERALVRVASAPPAAQEERDTLTLVREAVELLPARERDAVVLHYVDGLACDEIAEVLDSSPGAVRVRLHRARARLRRELAPLAPRKPATRPEEKTMIEMRLEDVLVRVDDEKIVADQRIVLLRDEDGARVLPIWIGAAEGNSLAVKLHSESTPRPMTSDLLAQLVQLFGGRVERVAVTRLHESTFYASITLLVDGRTDELDARPSDALNLAVRTAAPIFVATDVLEEAAVDRDGLQAKLDDLSDWTDAEPPPGEWRSLSVELVHTLHQPPRRKER